MCSECRTNQLAELIGDHHEAWSYFYVLRDARDALWDAEERAKRMEEKTNG